MIFRSFCGAVAVALLLAGCQGTAQDGSRPAMRVITAEEAEAPVRPGGLRLRTRAPDKDKWIARHETRSGRRSATIYRCRPLACPSNAAVVIETAPSPTRKPDPTALERLAAQVRVQAPPGEAEGEVKIEVVSSRVTRFKGYPAIFQEVRRLGNGSTIHSQLAVMFAGPVLIKVNAISQERAVAKKSLDDFIAVMEIEEGPPR